jgi:FixJ family two-component response regulator
MARTKKLAIQKRPQFTIHSVTFTPDVVEGLKQLSQGASDFLGRSISHSAVIHALIRHVAKQGTADIDALFLEIERELKSGVLWGKQK